eukprot:CAMPEP_0184693332 /NCGR_PEP_ID=MMETSP0313-20130426/1579_1 /TAXON_ID=2792 /ORGANISM="Porphyridium aerugineum, Strain SAG 1380-2" /LENGTH=84 /DNA_ID=CAMNT_0027151385 /DNA_START=282 /DNA_END=533 /DNA_ORIENTATION=-
MDLDAVVYVSLDAGLIASWASIMLGIDMVVKRQCDAMLSVSVFVVVVVVVVLVLLGVFLNAAVSVSVSVSVSAFAVGPAANILG